MEGFTWTKGQRERAAAEKLGLFAVACDAKCGRIGIRTPIDHATASNLTHFCFKVTRGASPAEAFKDIFGG